MCNLITTGDVSEVPSARNQYYGIDIIKFIMAVCVIAIHTQPIEKAVSWWPFYSKFLSMAVPFFFITSSFLLFKKYFAASSSDEANNILFKYVKHMVVLYFIWSIVYLPLAIVGYCAKQVSWWKATLVYFRDLFLKGEHFNSWPLWYLLATIYSTLLTQWLLKRNWKKKSILIFSAVIYVIAKFITLFVTDIDSYKGLEYAIARGISLSIGNGRLMTGFLFSAIGMCFVDSHILSKLKATYCFVLWLICFFVSSLLDYAFIDVMLYCFLFMTFINVSLPRQPFYIVLRRFSVYLYFLHMLFWSLWIFIVGWDNKYKVYHGFNGFTFTLLNSILLGAIIYILQRKYNWKWLKLLFN